MAKHDPFAALVAKTAKKAQQKFEQQQKSDQFKKKLEEQLGTTEKEVIDK